MRAVTAAARCCGTPLDELRKTWRTPYLPGIRTQPPHDFLSDAVPVDAARLPMPLHHQSMQRSHENTRLRLHLDIRAKLSGDDPRLQQLTERGDAARLPLSDSLPQ